jgi:hypothetical protein
MFSNPYGKHVKFCIKQGMNLKAIEQNSMLKHWYILCSKCFFKEEQKVDGDVLFTQDL